MLLEIGMSPALSEKEIAELIKHFDKNGTGVIDVKSFMGSVSAEKSRKVIVSQFRAMLGRRSLRSITMTTLKQTFALFDKDGDGTITRDEFFEAMERLDLGLTEKQLVELMGSFDMDGGGSLDLSEFVEMFSDRTKDTPRKPKKQIVQLCCISEKKTFLKPF